MPRRIEVRVGLVHEQGYVNVHLAWTETVRAVKVQQSGVGGSIFPYGHYECSIHVETSAPDPTGVPPEVTLRLISPGVEIPDGFTWCASDGSCHLYGRWSK